MDDFFTYFGTAYCICGDAASVRSVLSAGSFAFDFGMLCVREEFGY